MVHVEYQKLNKFRRPIGKIGRFSVHTDVFSKNGKNLNSFYYEELSMRIIQKLAEELKIVETETITSQIVFRNDIVRENGVIYLPHLPRSENVNDLLPSTVVVRTAKGHGTGIIIRGDGLVLTNNHVIAEANESVTIIDHQGISYKARIVEFKVNEDLALLEIISSNEQKFKPASLEFDSQPKLGNEVFAVGAPLSTSLANSVTSGIVSGKKTIDNIQYFQFDASVNSGNSGGPLADNQGNVIGIVTAKLKGVGNEGVGYAIPIGIIKNLFKMEVNND